MPSVAGICDKSAQFLVEARMCVQSADAACLISVVHVHASLFQLSTS
jgi:hypothetical protein